jgi:uncharacterized membrane protein
MAVLPYDIGFADAFAFGWFLLIWIGYTLVMDHLLTARFGINQYMKVIRQDWMLRMLDSENRIMDSALVGHTIHSITFFASTTMLVLVGLVGALGAIDSVYEVVRQIRFAAQTSKTLFELKLMLLGVIFIHAFFKFTWGLRQYNYCLALMGSAPLTENIGDRREALADNIAAMMTLGGASFNNGLRAYYFALAALGWFVSPWVYFAATNWIVLVLLRRQAWSRAFTAIKNHTKVLESNKFDSVK